MPEENKNNLIPRFGVLLAPMEDVTDGPFRIVCKRQGADIVYTEFINAEGLIRNNEKTKRKMIFREEERPFGIQLYGGWEGSMESAARMAEELQPDIIDINCGCWVKNVVGQGAGASLLRNLPLMRRIVGMVVDAVKVPVTVKTRLGWDSASINIVEIAQMIEQTGAKGLTIHCRTREQGHKGEPDYSWIPKVKAAVSIPIIVNGGIMTPQDAKRAFDETGCDAIMIARGAITNPWIFRDIKHYVATGEILPPVTLHERIKVMLDQLQMSVEHKGERVGVLEFRKYYAGYLSNFPGAAKMRMELMRYVDLQGVLDHVHCFAEAYGQGLGAASKDQYQAA